MQQPDPQMPDKRPDRTLSHQMLVYEPYFAIPPLPAGQLLPVNYGLRRNNPA
jgi:hypothetical protein